MSKRGYVGIVILALLVGLFIGYRVLAPTWFVSLQLKYDVLKDTLTIVLTVLAIGIAAIGYAIYLILSEKLKGESASAASLEVVKGAIRLSIILGFAFWESYDKAGEGEKEAHDLEMAIRLTQRALQYHYQLPEVVAHDRKNEGEFCLIKNNLAYYFAVGRKIENRDTAREYADYIRGQASKYADEKDNWLETYIFVKQHYPD